MEILQNLLSQLPLLVVSMGFMALRWREIGAMQASLGENATLAQLLAKLLAGQQVSLPPSVTLTKSALPPVAQPAIPADAGQPVDEALVAVVKKFEGFSAKAYGDYKQYSIGYGTKANSPTEVIDELEANRRLRVELAMAAKSVEAFCPNAPKGVKQAMIDMTYNVGPVWQHNDLGKLIHDGSYEDAKAHVLQYNHAGGQVNDGLTKRRQAEVSWFDNPL